jgi:hypothetical protein
MVFSEESNALIFRVNDEVQKARFSSPTVKKVKTST